MWWLGEKRGEAGWLCPIYRAEVVQGQSSCAGVLDRSISCGDVTSSGIGQPNLMMTIGDRAPLAVEDGTASPRGG